MMLQRKQRDSDIVVRCCRSPLLRACHFIIAHLETLRQTVSIRPRVRLLACFETLCRT